ncbi:MAG TPA: CPBP family intramembrane glutamic endopeptidase [Candidatus Eisenbacteria bacterium]|nr:CPBP family intramembrane glutamic endopeptidase [Candidatus Eisenbacteria bacterium]
MDDRAAPAPGGGRSSFETPVPRLRLAALLWALGMAGVVAVTVTLIPSLLAQLPMKDPLPMPPWAVMLLSLGQSAVILALAAWGGVALAPTVGLDAPLLRAALERRPCGPVVRALLGPGLVAGLLGGLFLFMTWRFVPTTLAPVQERLALPLFARVLYGGFTEELLLRWGLMAALVWLAYTWVLRRRARPGAGLVWLAIAVSALVFAAGHLPAAAFLAGPLDVPSVTWVVGVNSGFGLLFGYLFWRYGLESAMIAHGLTHVVHHLAGLV